MTLTSAAILTFTRAHTAKVPAAALRVAGITPPRSQPAAPTIAGLQALIAAAGNAIAGDKHERARHRGRHFRSAHDALAVAVISVGGWMRAGKGFSDADSSAIADAQEALDGAGMWHAPTATRPRRPNGDEDAHFIGGKRC